MTRSTFRVTIPDVLAPFEAKNYARGSGEPYPPNLIAELSPVDAPASGLSTTARDMTYFMRAHLGGGRFGEVQLLRPETVARMQEPAFVPIPGAQPIGLGLFHTGSNGRRIVGHSGDGEGFHAEYRLLPAEGVGVFIAMNSDGAVDGIFPAAFALRARLFDEFLARYFPSPSPIEEPTAPTAAEHARLAAGEYVWSRQSQGDYQEALGLVGRYFGLKLIVRANPDGTIETPPAMTFATDGKARIWREVGPFVWREVGGNASLVMTVHDGRVASVWSDATASFWVNLRVPTLRSARLNVPLVGLAGVILILAALGWPVVAVLERRRRGQLTADPSRRWVRLTRAVTVVAVVYLVGWFAVLAMDAPSSLGSRPWIRSLQAVGVVTLLGAVVAVRNAWLVWTAPGSAAARVGRSAVALALCYLAWFSLTFHLLSLRID